MSIMTPTHSKNITQCRGFKKSRIPFPLSCAQNMVGGITIPSLSIILWLNSLIMCLQAVEDIALLSGPRVYLSVTWRENLSLDTCN
jgi:hypothetical protein